MTVQTLYDHITKHMTAEEALLKLLGGSLRTYQKLRFEDGEEVHPLFITVMAAEEMNWVISIEKSDNPDEEVQGISIGTEEYMDKLFKDKKDEPTTIS